LFSAFTILANNFLPLSAALGIREELMKYTKWLIENYPELEAESSVKIFNYVRQAKSDTKPQRMLIAFLYFITMMLFVCFLGYFLGRFTEVKVGITMAIAFGISILVSCTIEKRTKQKIIQKKLIELVGKNA
jgi:hypothetical protein